MTQHLDAERAGGFRIECPRTAGVVPSRRRAMPVRRNPIATCRHRSIRPCTRPRRTTARHAASSWPTVAAVRIGRQPIQSRQRSRPEHGDSRAVQTVGGQILLRRRKPVVGKRLHGTRHQGHRAGLRVNQCIELRQHGGSTDPQQHDLLEAGSQQTRCHVDGARLHSPTNASPDTIATSAAAALSEPSNQATPSSCGLKYGSPHQTAPTSTPDAACAIAAASGLGTMGPVRHDEHRGDRDRSWPLLGRSIAIAHLGRIFTTVSSEELDHLRSENAELRRRFETRSDRDRRIAGRVAAATRRGSSTGRRPSDRGQPPDCRARDGARGREAPRQDRRDGTCRCASSAAAPRKALRVITRSH